MTENEIFKGIHKDCGALEICNYKETGCGDCPIRHTLIEAEKALEEIQQYRALEEKLNGISVEQVVNGFISTVEKETQEGYERGRILTNKEADEWNELQAIGTIEEFKALKEKATPKKDNNDRCRCKNCGTYNNFIVDNLFNPEGHPVVYCWNCGQAINLREEG